MFQFMTLFFIVSTAMAQGIERLDAAAVVKNATLTVAEKVTLLSSMGDRLMTTYSFMYADEVYSQVLLLDPDNVKALVLSSFLRPVRPIKGLLYRDEDRRKNSSPESQAAFDIEMSTLDRNGSTYRFWFDSSQQKFKDEADYQIVVNQINSEAVRSRLTLRKLSKQSFKMNLNWSLFPKDANASCDVKQIAPLVYDKSPCDFDRNINIEFDEADITNLFFFATILDLMTVLGDAYTLDGVIDVINMKSYDKVHISDQVQFEYLRSIPEFGLLKSKNRLNRALEIGADVITALRLLTDIGSGHCQASFGSDVDPRKDKHLFAGGDFCMYMSGDDTSGMDLTAKQLLGMFSSIVAKNMFKLNVRKRNNPTQILYSTNILPSAIFLQPVNDLKTVLPNKFNICGENNGFADDTLAGLFPAHDANIFFEMNGDFKKTCSR